MTQIEEKILDILNEKVELSLTGSYKSVYIDGQENATKEISSLIEKDYYEKEFVKWVGYYTLSNGQKYFPKVEFFKDKNNEMTLDELYQYWLTNIKDK